MSYVWYWKDTFLRPESDQSLRDLAETGTNWVSLVVIWYENTDRDVNIFPTNSTPSDASLKHAIQTIHGLGMKVMIKPHINPLTYYTGGSGKTSLQPTNVTAWFQSYRTFILRYAELAQSEHVEQLAVGVELVTMSQYTQQWYGIIDAVRRSYNGTLTYASLATTTNDKWSEWKLVQFWDKLDYVGMDVYFPLTTKPDPTRAELINGWSQYVTEIETFQRSVKKPIVFTEIGWVSVAGANTGTWKWDHTCNPSDSQYDKSKCKPYPQEQANLYEVALQVFWNKPWLQGIFWWIWYPYGTKVGWGEGGLNDPYYSPHNKPAEQVLRSWYAKPFIPQGTPPEAATALIAIQTAENATSTAMQQGRIMGLDQAQSLSSKAINSYNSGEYGTAEDLANQAVQLALKATLPQTSTPTMTGFPYYAEKAQLLRIPELRTGQH